MEKEYSTPQEIFEYLRASGANAKILEGFQRILDQRSKDGLTGLLNRRTIEERLKEELARTKRHKTDLSIILLDIDFFKKVNDTYGHPAGDEVLKEIGKYLSENIREEDSLGRYGGEEFLVILPQTSQQGAYDLAERIRKGIKNTTIRVQDNNKKDHNIRITLSVGVTTYKPNQPMDDLIKKADSALYSAKESGRDQVKTE